MAIGPVFLLVYKRSVIRLRDAHVAANDEVTIEFSQKHTSTRERAIISHWYRELAHVAVKTASITTPVGWCNSQMPFFLFCTPRWSSFSFIADINLSLRSSSYCSVMCKIRNNFFVSLIVLHAETHFQWKFRFWYYLIFFLENLEI